MVSYYDGDTRVQTAVQTHQMTGLRKTVGDTGASF